MRLLNPLVVSQNHRDLLFAKGHRRVIYNKDSKILTTNKTRVYTILLKKNPNKLYKIKSIHKFIYWESSISTYCARKRKNLNPAASLNWNIRHKALR